MVLICVHSPPTPPLPPPNHLECPCGRGSVTRTRGGWPLVAAVVIQHGKQFTKLQLSDILYRTKSERERGEERVRQGTEPHIQKGNGRWMDAPLAPLAAWLHVPGCLPACLHRVINLKLRFGSFKYSISCEIFRLHRQRHCSEQCTHTHTHRHVNAYGITRMVTVDFCTFEEHLQHICNTGKGCTNLLKVLSM